MNTEPRPLLRPADQGVVATFLLASAAIIAASLAVQSCRHGGLVDIDRARDQQVRFQVDANAASWPELALLPEVGETLARRIVESREQDGPFLCPEDLGRVEGIGDVTLEQIRPYLLPMAGPLAEPPSPK